MDTIALNGGGSTEKKEEDSSSSSSRITWDHPIEYLLNVIGYNVGLGNVWRFSYLCYKNGGGAFLIPYLIVAAFCGLPMLFMETSMGQFTQHGCLGAWNMVPVLKGVGFAGLLISWYFLSYIMVVMAWVVFYLTHSFTTGPLPWSACDNDWNTNSCRPAIVDQYESENISAYTFNLSTVNTTSSTEEFWSNYVLRRTDGIHDLGTFTNWRMILCFLSSWAICFLCVWKGIRTTGKVAYVTVLSPYVFLLILLVRGATLQGAGDGVMYYISPRLDRLADPVVWLDAAGQVLYTLAVCFAVLYGLGSYNKFHTDCYKNAFICVGACCGTSVFVGFVLFCYLGHMAFVQGKNITDVAAEGPGLVFEVFPAGLTLLPVSQLWSVIFFIMLIFFAIDSAFGSIEGVTRLLEDIRPNWFVRPGPKICRLGMCVFPFLLGLPMLFDGGIYIFELVNLYGNSGICILLIAFFEVVGISWIYGIDKFFDDVQSMIGYRPHVFFKVCLKYIDPVIALSIFLAFCFRYTPLTLDEYTYPDWANAVGWMISMTVIAPIPIVAIFTLLRSKGTWSQRWKSATTSRYERPPIYSDSNEYACSTTGSSSPTCPLKNESGA